MPPPEGKHDVSRARPAAYNNGSPRAPVVVGKGRHLAPGPPSCLPMPRFALLAAPFCRRIHLFMRYIESQPILKTDGCGGGCGQHTGSMRLDSPADGPCRIYPSHVSRPDIQARYPGKGATSHCTATTEASRQSVSPSVRQSVSPSVRQHINLATPACTPIKTGALTAPVTKGRWPGLSPGWPDPRGRRTPA